MRTNPFFIFIPPIRPASNTVRMNNYNKLQRKKSSPFAETPYFRLTPTFGRLVPYKKIYNFRGTLSHSLPRVVFEKTPLGTLKNFFRFVKAKPDGLSVFRVLNSSIESMLSVRRKSFRIDPFFKRGRRVAGRGALQREPGCGAGHPAGVSRLGFRVSLSQSNRMPSAAHFRRSSSLQREDWTCPTCTFSKITIQILDCPMPPPTVRGSSP